MLTTAFVAMLAMVGPGLETLAADDPFQEMRREMVDQQVRQRGIDAPRILSALEQVPRHRFVPEALGNDAYDDDPVAVGPDGQTLPQSYVSARMLDLLDLDGDETVLEVGTGTGYDAAVLSLVAREVYTVEIDETVARKARETLRKLGYSNVFVLAGDGYRGWPEKAPFDAILLTAATPRVPEPLFDQLAPGGRMVVAVGSSLHQDLLLVTKTAEGERRVRRASLVSLSPMTGEVQTGPPPSLEDDPFRDDRPPG